MSLNSSVTGTRNSSFIAGTSQAVSGSLGGMDPGAVGATDPHAATFGVDLEATLDEEALIETRAGVLFPMRSARRWACRRSLTCWGR